MTGLGSVKCPRCGGSIGLRAVGIDADSTKTTAVVRITLNPLDVRRHALCFQPPPDGEPLPHPAAA